ncbi:MAG: hypothetical protein JW791_01320 [Nanoarchaeota archaeon]|nr:hypothetical protein [Nanoarchaeota archaeon]
MTLVESLKEDLLEHNNSLVEPFFTDYAIGEIKKLSITEARQLMDLVMNEFNAPLARKYCTRIVELNEDFQLIRPEKNKITYFPILTGSFIDE